MYFKILTCCKYSLSGTTFASHELARLPCGESIDSLKTTKVSFKKFLPIIKSSNPPSTGHESKDFLLTSGTPGGWAV